MASAASTPLHDAIETQVRPFLDLIDHLRTLGINEDIPLPQIAVVGDQSSGKSSLLEALSGIPFPRGSGLTTRCPTRIVMKRTAPSSPWRAYIRLSSSTTPPVLISSPNELSSRIEAFTDSLTRSQGSTFSTDCIIVNLESPNVPDLSLIDLPGIIRTVTDNQASEVIQQVNKLIQAYIDVDRTVILAVVPANQDIATVDVLERASIVDPGGVRTIGVLTKADLIGPGNENEVLAVLNNIRKPLRLGYVIVKNRNQNQLTQQTSLEDARMDELRFFEQHAVFRTVDKSVVGIESLSRRLTQVLVSRIKAALPLMTLELKQQLQETDSVLVQMGKGPPQETFAQRTELIQVLSRFSTVLREIARGEYRDPLLTAQPELRLRTILDGMKKSFQSQLIGLKPDFDSDGFRNELRGHLRDLRGREPPGFTNTQFFVTFMTMDMERWRGPIEANLSSVAQALKRVCVHLVEALAPRYPKIVNMVAEVVAAAVEQAEDGALLRIEEYLIRHTENLSTYDELLQAINTVRFNAFERALTEIMQSAGDRPMDSTKTTKALNDFVKLKLGAWYMATHGVTSEYQVDDVRATLKAYWAVCARRLHEETGVVSDSLLIGKAVDQIEKELLEVSQVRAQFDQASLALYFSEDQDSIEQRRLLGEKQARIRGALLAVQQLVPDLPSSNSSEITSARPFRPVPVVLPPPTVAAPAPGKPVRISTEQKVSSTNEQLSQRVQQTEEKQAASVAAVSSTSRYLQPHDVPIAGQVNLKATSGAERPVSEPEGLAQNMTDGCVAVFTYTQNGDNRGYIYWLGTTGYVQPFQNPHTLGRIRVSSSGMAEGDETIILSRKRAMVWTHDSADSFVTVDFGRNRSLLPSHITLLHGNTSPGHDMINYTIEGFDSLTTSWIVLLDHQPPLISGRVLTISVPPQTASYRRIRVRATGKQQDGLENVQIGGLEFYGKLYKHDV